MAKLKNSYSCSNCAYSTVKWIGCCPSCGEWNSFIEDTSAKEVSYSNKNIENIKKAVLFQLQDIRDNTKSRMIANIKEWDTVLGGGILPGSFIILTGDPGIGKSTLLLQIAHAIALHYDVIYFSSEESLEQVKGRALRLKITGDRLRFSDEANLHSIVQTAIYEKPALIILDSIQNCHLSDQLRALPGTIAQLRESGFVLMRLAKEHDIAILVTGHITKEGEMAGPKVLEHMVDAVFYLQAEDRWHTRVLRSVKNRFGTINEVGFFEMQENGLQEVANINQQFIDNSAHIPGSVLVCCIEGTRPLLFELQALVVESKYGVPQRVVTGLDHKRVVLIAAILEKYLRIKFSIHDIFFKISGGFKIKESAADLGIALALLSSYFQHALPRRSVALGEVSLTGQIKAVNQVSLCVKEIEKFGLEKIFLSSQQQIKSTCSLGSFKTVYDLLSIFPV